MKNNYKEFVDILIERLKIEFKKQDRSGVYGETQRLLAFNSNRIEGSSLSYNQTASIFETGTVSIENDIIRTKDIEEMNGHFLMFNNMLENYDSPLTEEMIKSFHYDLKYGVFEDKANGYPVGEYKNRGNRVSDIETSKPREVSQKIADLLSDYNNK
ncbi:MAG TPA: Fic family protein, partial [Firmicutes bacterium]|nr:Fic family protein [Bacillota bacterium]